MNQFLTHSGLYTDFYELTMAQGYFRAGKANKQASFDYFFRKLPFGGGYVIHAGLSDLLAYLTEMKFTSDDLHYLKNQRFQEDFLDYLEQFCFTGNVHAMREGEVVFPNEPVLRVDAPIIEAQIIETVVLNILNFESLIATKASRIRSACGKRSFMDFGLRRAHGWGGLQASKAAMIGGADSTSNVLCGKLYEVPVAGTQAHSWIESYDSELEAFHAFASLYPDLCILVVDTYDTLRSGIPNAIQVAKAMEEKGFHMAGIRLDSGDFVTLSKKVREMLDKAGLGYVRIVASNQLDEYEIERLLSQNAPVDSFGVGTSLVTGDPDGALDGVYKMSSFDDQPRIKISESADKILLPGKKQVFRSVDITGCFMEDLIVLEDEVTAQNNSAGKETLLSPVVTKGSVCFAEYKLTEISAYCMERLSKLPDKLKKLTVSGSYPVRLSKKLETLKKSMVNTILQNIHEKD